MLTLTGCSSRTLKPGPSEAELQSLFQSVGQNRVNDVEILIKNGVPVDSVNSLGVSPLMLASFKGLDQMTAYLLSEGADPNLGDNRKTTPMHYASQKGNSSTLNLLLEAGGKVDNVDSDGFTPLHLSVRFGPLDSSTLLLERGADANVKDALGTPVLFFAVVRGSHEQVRQLIEHGAFPGVPDADNLTPLTRSIETQNKDIFNVLLKALLDLPLERRGPVSDIHGNTSLHYAAAIDNPSFLKELLEIQSRWPFDLNFQNKAGETPAMWAVARRRTEQLHLLLDKNIDVELVDKRGWDLREYLLSKDFSEAKVDELFSTKNKK